jgi:endonuclease/exonuclease/phosphatase family metal-dependent hydrolase
MFACSRQRVTTEQQVPPQVPPQVHPKFGPLIETRLRVVTWNLWGRGGPWSERHERITSTLLAVQPDVVALQEVWAEEGGRSQADLLAAALGFDRFWASRYAIDGVAVGNAILSRWPIAKSEVRWLPARPDLEELRNVIRTAVDGPRGRLVIYTTHLNWRFDQSDVRQEQVRFVARLITEMREEGFPPILTGDFNAAPDSDEIRMLTGRMTLAVPGLVFHDAWEVAGDGGAGFTWTNANPWARQDLEPDRRIDYVFVGWPKKGGAGHVTSCRLIGQAIDGVFPSDHLGVMAELRY